MDEPVRDISDESRHQPLSREDERTWAMLAHLSILANLVTGFLGLIAAFVIYLIFKDRSRYVAYQSIQSVIFQLIAWVVGGTLAGIVWAVTGVLSAFIVGICMIPLAILISLIPVAALVYGIIAAVKCSNGEDFRYWLIGDWFRNDYEPVKPD
jgi:uncharacterized protein